MAAALRVTLVLTALIGAAFGQTIPEPEELVECFVDDNCQIDATPLLTTPRDCCFNNPNTFSFRRTEGDEGCNPCFIFGFVQTEFTAVERGQGYSLEVGYIKRPAVAPPLAFGVSSQLLGTTTGGDFTLQTTSALVLPNQATPRLVTFTFRVDSIAQELDESVRLILSDPPALNNQFAGMINDSVYFINTADLVILDGDDLKLQFTEEDYRVGEEEGTIPVRVNKNNRIATPVTIVVTPMTLFQNRANGRDDPVGALLPNQNSPIEADENDFDPTPIVVTFLPDERGVAMNDIDTPVPIVDDLINEATEQNLVLILDIVNATNTSRISIARNIDSLGRIIDNDPIAIGFQRPVYHVFEPVEPIVDIVGLIHLEKEGGVVSEQTFSVVVTVTPTAPDDSIGPAEVSSTTADNNYSIGAQNFVVFVLYPHEQTVDFNFQIFNDDIAEGTEAFQAAFTQAHQSLHHQLFSLQTHLC